MTLTLTKNSGEQICIIIHKTETFEAIIDAIYPDNEYRRDSKGYISLVNFMFTDGARKSLSEEFFRR